MSTGGTRRLAPRCRKRLPKGPLVERWGPGTGGTPGFSAVDPDLNRPNMNEMVVGFQFRPAPSWVTRIAGIARLDNSLLAVTNVGVPFSTYTRTHVIDPGSTSSMARRPSRCQSTTDQCRPSVPTATC
jgi:hypothetical protein